MVKPPSFKTVPGMFIYLNLPCIAKAGAPRTFALVCCSRASAPADHTVFAASGTLISRTLD